MDRVLRPAVVGSVGLIVVDFRVRLRQNLLASLHSFECGDGLRLMGRDTVDLLGIKDGIDPMDQRGSVPIVLIARHWIRDRRVYLVRLRILPELDL
jgi:hypothetical protein